ncbi:MAG: hypothetical protein RBG1_1C00001G0671 [candidate division Zixibacteria bacterium RBG-1]|nr:MAG: hypothetical protein RBG1_1C00001G0671 [candidate division Zixibacteria bacterium RBG-1]OGC85908.1 MAG: hypothetical protein A2V73_08130 [candidate division Zixibacteria bacterium RBG_19FT_COMBO_42_43]
MKMKRVSPFILSVILMALSWFTLLVKNPPEALSYPPAVGILGKVKNCVSCHANSGPWTDEGKTIIDIIDKGTRKSLKQADGSFLISVKRNQLVTVLTVIGRSKDDKQAAPYRNAWLYVDPKTINNSSLSKFAAGWDVNLPLSCRVVGDTLAGFQGAKITVLPMSIRPTDAALDAELTLQVMLTKGESVKGNPRKGMLGNYFEKKVVLQVME